MAGLGSKILQLVLPKKKANPKGSSSTSTYNPSSANTALSAQSFRAHLTDIFTSRTSQDSRALLKDLTKYDSDVSAALHAYLTTAKTTPRFWVYTQDGKLDRAGMQTLNTLIQSLTQRTDYSTGFQITKSLEALAEDCRYAILASGGVSGELVFNKLLLPAEFRFVDVAALEWYEPQPGQYKPQQKPTNGGQNIVLDIPNFFYKAYRQNPNEIYAESMFVSAINTIAARQQVINDLYRIMQKTGYPRIEATVMEEVLRKNAPQEMKENETKMITWINARLQDIALSLTDMRPDAVWVHTDAVEGGMINEGGPARSMDVSAIIDVLNSQNQAALKTMATVIGRGEAGVNTGTVEARIFSMSADSLNQPIADLFSDMFTLALRLTGYQGYVTCKFDPVEMRPATELEAQLTMRQARLLEQLSLGTITDDEFHIQVNGRLRPDSAPELSGTGFMQAQAGGGVDAGSVSPNSDPLGRSLTSSNSKSAKSNTTKSTAAKK